MNELVFQRVALTGIVRQFDREYISNQDWLRRASGSPSHVFRLENEEIDTRLSEVG
jgi:hypothetical protein